MSESQDIIVENEEWFRWLETNRSHAAFVQNLPQALSYVAELETGSHAILFYDNLAAAAEYICAFVEEGIRRRQSTSFLGLSPERYEAVFDQVGIKTAMLETCGYLHHPSIKELTSKDGQVEKKRQVNLETLLRTNMESECQGTRFILLNEYPLHGTSFRGLMDFERWLNTGTAATVLCCYDARQVFEETYYNLFTELLKAHGHCVFQGIAMPTSTITGDRSTSYAAPKSMRTTDAMSPV